jgi:hypothetical protein
LQLEQQDEYLIGKIEEVKTLNEEHEKLIGASSGVPDLHGSRIFIQITSSELQG